MGKIVLIKLFEISKTESKESMRWSRRSAMAAPGWPWLAITPKRWRFEANILVSDIEKNPERANKKITKTA